MADDYGLVYPPCVITCRHLGFCTYLPHQELWMRDVEVSVIVSSTSDKINSKHETDLSTYIDFAPSNNDHANARSWCELALSFAEYAGNSAQADEVRRDLWFDRVENFVGRYSRGMSILVDAKVLYGNIGVCSGVRMWVRGYGVCLR